MPEVTFHGLRHTHASQLISSGVDIVTVSKRLGHAKPSGDSCHLRPHVSYGRQQGRHRPSTRPCRLARVAIGWQCSASVLPGTHPKSLKIQVRSCGRVAEGGGLLNRYRVVKPYRGFESLRLRQKTAYRLVVAMFSVCLPELRTIECTICFRRYRHHRSHRFCRCADNFSSQPSCHDAGNARALTHAVGLVEKVVAVA